MAGNWALTRETRNHGCGFTGPVLVDTHLGSLESEWSCPDCGHQMLEVFGRQIDITALPKD